LNSVVVRDVPASRSLLICFPHVDKSLPGLGSGAVLLDPIHDLLDS
jgi:hypothetical protein